MFHFGRNNNPNLENIEANFQNMQRDMDVEQQQEDDTQPPLAAENHTTVTDDEGNSMGQHGEYYK